jgi:DNA-binding MarR family transcriptional regulator
MTDRRLEKIADNLLLFFPMFRRRLMKGGHQHISGRTSSQEYPVLGMLTHHDALTMSGIQERMCMSKSNTTSLVDKLIESGRVERLFDPDDRRVIKIAITAKGRAFMQDHKKIMREVVKGNISQLSSKDLDTLCISLENMKNVISKISEED